MTCTQAYSDDDITRAIIVHLDVMVWRYPVGGGTVQLEARVTQATTTEHCATTPHGDREAQRERIANEIEETKRETRAKVASMVLEAIERARRAGTITTTNHDARWTAQTLRRHLVTTIDVDTAQVHAPRAPPADYWGTRSETTATFSEYGRARCAEHEAEATADDLRRATRLKVSVRIARALGAEPPR